MNRSDRISHTNQFAKTIPLRSLIIPYRPPPDSVISQPTAHISRTSHPLEANQHNLSVALMNAAIPSQIHLREMIVIIDRAELESHPISRMTDAVWELVLEAAPMDQVLGLVLDYLLEEEHLHLWQRTERDHLLWSQWLWLWFQILKIFMNEWWMVSTWWVEIKWLSTGCLVSIYVYGFMDCFGYYHGAAYRMSALIGVQRVI